MAHIEVNTSRYQTYTGKAPKGLGNWAFKVSGEEELRFYWGKYSDAKKALIADLRKEYPANAILHVNVME